jgi:hypothetical protein
MREEDVPYAAYSVATQAGQSAAVHVASGGQGRVRYEQPAQSIGICCLRDGEHDGRGGLSLHRLALSNRRR